MNNTVHVTRVQSHAVHADQPARRLDRSRLRQDTGAIHETPATDQRRNGDVEGAARFLPQTARLLQQTKQSRSDAHWAKVGLLVQAGDLAPGAVQTQLRLQAVDLIQGLLPRRAQADGIVAMQHDLEACRHGVAGNQSRGGGTHGDVVEDSEGSPGGKRKRRSLPTAAPVKSENLTAQDRSSMP